MSRTEQLVAEILGKAEVKVPPIPVAKLASLAGARLVFEPLEGEAWGMLFRVSEASIIGVNSARTAQKQRFIAIR